MKIRNGFVSNSSSSSFIINKKYLLENQILLIKNHIENGKELNITYSENDDEWSISEDEETISGYTTMDNFDMRDYLDKIDVDSNKIEWRE